MEKNRMPRPSDDRPFEYWKWLTKNDPEFVKEPVLGVSVKRSKYGVNFVMVKVIKKYVREK